MENVDFDEVAKSLKFGENTTIGNWVITHKLQYRKGLGAGDVHNAHRKAIKNGRGKTENELDFLSLYLSQVFKNKPYTILSDWAPYEFVDGSFHDTQAFKFKDVKVIKTHGRFDRDVDDLPWIGTHKYVLNWCELENGYAVGWNENPAVGWAFPVKKLK